MSETSAPAVRARLRVVGRALGRPVRAYVRSAETVELVLTDKRTGAAVTDVSGVRVAVRRPEHPGRPVRPRVFTDVDFTPAAFAAGIFAIEVYGDEAGTWTVEAEVTSPRCSADRVSLEFVA